MIAVGALPRSIISETERAEAVSAQPALAIQQGSGREAIALSGLERPPFQD